MKKICLLLLLSLYTITHNCIQVQIPTYRQVRREIRQITQFYQDTLSAITQKYFPENEYPERLLIEQNRDLNPLFFKLFIPLTYYNAPIREALILKWVPKEIKPVSYPTQELFPIDIFPLNSTKRIEKSVNNALLMAYLQYPEKVVTTEGRIARRRRFQDKAMPKHPSKTNVIEIFKPEKDIIEEKVAEITDLEIDFVVKNRTSGIPEVMVPFNLHKAIFLPIGIKEEKVQILFYHF